MSSTIDLNRIQYASSQRVRRSPASDAECEALGIVHVAQKEVYRAIKGNSGITTEAELSRIAALRPEDVAKAVQDLTHAGIIRKGHTAFSASGPFEIVPPRPEVNRGSI